MRTTMGTHWISKELLAEEGAGLAPGTTININHPDCPAGTDKRQRLYITCTTDGTLLAYCHNCGARGSNRTRKVTSNIHTYRNPHDYLRDADSSTFIDRGELTTLFGIRPALIDNIKCYMTIENTVFNEFIDRYHIDIPMAWETDEWRVLPPGMVGSFVIASQRVSDYWWLCFPIRDNDDVLVGMEVKRLGREKLFDFDKNELRKTMTFGRKLPRLVTRTGEETVVVVVEDRISAHAVVQVEGCAAYCLHGSRALSGEEAHKLATTFDHVMVWLDNDNTTVNDNADLSTAVLQMFTSNVHRSFLETEPKNTDRDFMRGYLNATRERHA